MLISTPTFEIKKNAKSIVVNFNLLLAPEFYYWILKLKENGTKIIGRFYNYNYKS
jgi:hypothetical protein